jgi:hypothetical protein
VTSGPARVAYLTDVEGMWDKVATFATGNPLVSLDAAGRLAVRAGAVFVFGGDAVDRGPDARRVVATLVEAKRRQPDQVVLLAGNRDINKLRLVRELAGEPPQRTPAELRSAPRPVLLRWIFEHTMGAPRAFALRADELARERGAPPTDDEIVDSFLDDVAPGGPLRAYLRAAQLAWRAGRTLFVHGGLSKDSLGAVPGEPTPARPEDVDVDAWVARLNAWYAGQLDAFEAGRPGDDGHPAWAPLIAYQAPLPGTRVNPASVVYGRLADEHNNLRLPGDDVQRALAAAGVRRVILGHTPSGDAPSILRDRGFELVCADNSHARHGVGSKVLVHDDWLAVEGAVKLDEDGGAAEHAVRFVLAADDEATPIGRRTRGEGRLVKGALGDGRLHLYRALPGWKTEQLAVPADAVGAVEPAY